MPQFLYRLSAAKEEAFMRANLTAITLVGIVAILVTPAAFAQFGGGSPQYTFSPKSGMPRGWEAGIQVNPYSVVEST
jgi:hypothetical protein